MDSNKTSNERLYLNNSLIDYPLHLGEKKFLKDGSVISYPGCTVICKIPEDTSLSRDIAHYQSLLINFLPKNTYAFLPVSSFHMTLFDCCNIETKGTNYWPKGISDSMSYSDIAKDFKKRIENLSLPKSFSLELERFYGGFSMILRPNSESSEQLMRGTRDKLSDLFQIKMENHYRYTFHITLAYPLKQLDVNEIDKLIEYEEELKKVFNSNWPILKLENPVLCVFDNMLSFQEV